MKKILIIESRIEVEIDQSIIDMCIKVNDLNAQMNSREFTFDVDVESAFCVAFDELFEAYIKLVSKKIPTIDRVGAEAIVNTNIEDILNEHK